MLAVVSLLGGCGGGGGTGSTRGLVFTERDSSVRVHTGETFEVRLVSNPSTGYSWKVSALPVELSLLQEQFRASASNRLGAPGQQVFRFRGTRPGRATLQFSYARSFEANAPVKTFALVVRIAA